MAIVKAVKDEVAKVESIVKAEVGKVEESVKNVVSKTVKMVRPNTVPSEADVHVDEVDHWKLHGWSLK